MLERAPAVGAAWRAHYDRLHLHTNNRLSSLPYLRFPAGTGRYPSREQVVGYLEAYASFHKIEPRFRAEVKSIRPDRGCWRVVFEGEEVAARNVVVATGYNRRPVMPHWKGQETFPGDIIHSARYKSGAGYRGRRVLVVGFGNSGGEIALDLAEHGAKPTISVRSPVNLIPRQLFGVPILALAIPLSRIPPVWADAVSAPLLRAVIGRYEALGLRRSAKGPFRQIAEDRRIPLIDVGTVKLLRQGGAAVKPGLVGFNGAEARFADGTAEAFDAVVAATGFRPSCDELLQDAEGVTTDLGAPRSSGDDNLAEGLYFCGFRVAPTGMLREIGIEARRIARKISEQAGVP